MYSIVLAFLPAVAAISAEAGVTLEETVAAFHEAYASWDGDGFEQAADVFAEFCSGGESQACYWQGAALFHCVLYRLGAQDMEDESVSIRLAEAQESLERAVSEDPQDGEAHALLASVIGMRIAEHPLTSIWRGRAVMRHRKEALKLAPRSPRVHYLTGSSYYHAPAILGGRDRSLEYFLTAEPLFEEEALEPPDPLAPRWGRESCLSFIALVYEEQGNTQEALAYFRKALNVNPKDRLAREGLDRLSSTEGEASE